ncbi:MAG: SPOR domain-containing protein [Magnetococcales bacterium]|nr:SPOR domain-containing protein [Magnetococcales bacterium]
MKQMKTTVKSSLYGLSLLLLVSGCSTQPPIGHSLNHHDSMERIAVNTNDNTEFLIKMDVGSFCRAGDYWGANLRNDNGNLYGKKHLNPDFVHFLRTGEMNANSQATPLGRFYFGVNQELRNKFNSCFRTTFARMDADEVLGYHVSTAAGEVGREIGSGFAQWPKKFFKINLERSANYQGKFDTLLKETNTHAVAMLELFEELLTSGSPADRQAFKNGFVCSYRESMRNTLAEMKIEMPAVVQKTVPGAEDLSQAVVCPNVAAAGYELIYTRTDNFMTKELEGRFYANHTIEANDTDKLAFRIFSAEELYLRHYRRALHSIGTKLGNALFHGLKERNDGVEYLRNLSYAVNNPEDIQLYLAPGFKTSFEYGGERYLKEMLAQLNLPRGGEHKAQAPQKEQPKQAPAPQKDQPKQSSLTPETQPAAPAVAKSATPAAQPAAVAVTPAAAPSTTVATAPASAGNCFVHIGSYLQKSSVDAAEAQLKKNGISNVSMKPVTIKQNNAEGTQVRVGPFPSKDAAQTERNRLSGSMAGSIGGVVCDI